MRLPKRVLAYISALDQHAPMLCRLRRKPKGLVEVRTVKNPHPDWQPGQKLPHPFESKERLELDPAQLGAALYPFVISSVVPRPIAFISSLSKEVCMRLSCSAPCP